MSKLYNITDKYISTINTIKREPAIVVSSENEETGKFTVKLVNSQSLTMLSLLNKTGEKLTMGDYVWIYYWQSITDGYIAIRVGMADWTIGVGSSVGLPRYIGELPLYRNTDIDNAYVLREKSVEYKTTYTYEIEDNSSGFSVDYPKVDPIIRGDYSQYCGEYSYQSSGKMNDDSVVFFSWLPHTTSVFDLPNQFYVYHNNLALNIAVQENGVWSYERHTFVLRQEEINVVKAYDIDPNGVERPLNGTYHGATSDYGFTLVMGTSTNQKTVQNQIEYFPYLRKPIYNLILYLAYKSNNDWLIDNGSYAIRETLKVVAQSDSIAGIMNKKNVIETKERGVL